MTSAVETSTTASPTKLATNGAIAGLAGGLIFGMMMAMMNMLPMVGMLVGQESSMVGFIVHMAISAILGAIYGVVIGRFPNNAATALVGGTVYGIIWWVLGALVMMPLMLGMTQMVFVIGTAQWMSLVGHIIFGLVTAFVFIPLAKRS